MSLSSPHLRSTTATTHSASTSSTGMSSPRPSDTALWTRAGETALHIHMPRRTCSSQRPLLRTAFSSFTGLATVIVGEANSRTETETTYLVHKELLASASPFFAAALNGRFAEGLDQRIRLSEEKPEIFEWFLQWLYTGTLTTQPACAEPMHSPARATYYSADRQPRPVERTTRTTTSPPPPPAGPDDPAFFPSSSSSTAAATAAATAKLDGDLRNAAGSPKYFLLLDLYALAERLLVSGLGNDVLSTIARLSEATNSVPTPSDTWLLYDGAAGARTGGRARALVLDLFAYKKTDRLLETHRDEWHPRFLRELAVRLKRPGRAALERHSLVAWRPRSWSQTRACEGCRDVLRPGVGSGDRCCVCDKAFCNACLRRHALDAAFAWPHEPSGCKPWAGRGMCLRYHEHAEGELCG